MRKGIKNLLKKATKTAVWVVSTLLVLLIMLPLLASLLINVPLIQNAVVHRMMSELSEKLGTAISVDRVDIKLFNRVVAEGFYVEDFRGDTLLYAPRVTAPIVELGLTGASLTFGRVKLEGAEMWIRRDTAGVFNIKQMVKAIRGDRPRNPDPRFRMKMLGIEADGLTFGLLRAGEPPREGVDFSRFVIRNTHVDIDDFSIAGDTIRIGIRSLAFDERSGWRIDRLEAHDLVVSDGSVGLDNVRIRAAGANLDIPSIRIHGNEWGSFREFIDSVAVDVTMRPSHLSTGFLGWFVPAAKDWDITLDDLALQTEGPVAAMSGNIEQARTFDTSLALDFTSRGMPDIRNMHLDADIKSLTTTGRDVDSLVRKLTGKRLPESLAASVQRAGRIGLTGKFSGRLADFAARGTLSSDAGGADASATVKTLDAGTSLDGRVVIPGLDIGRVLAVGDMGTVAGEFDLNGTLAKGGGIEGAIRGALDALEFRGYSYSGLTLDGRLADKVIDGALKAGDPALDLDLSGEIDLRDSIPRYDIALDLRRADLALAGLDGTDSVSLLSGRATLLAAGRGLDDMNGTVLISDPAYISSADTVRTDVVTVIARNGLESKYIGLSSEFADAEFRSRINYRDMFAYLGDCLWDYIPKLYEGGDRENPLPPIEPAMTAAANYSVLKLDVKNTDELFDALMPGTRIAPQSSLSFMFNPFVRSFSLTGSSEFIEYGEMLATDIELNSDNKSDSLTLHLTGKDLYSGSMHIPTVALHGGSKGRRATISTRLNGSDDFSAMLGMNIESELADGRRRLRFRFTPSYLSLDERTWYLRASSVTYDTARMEIAGLRLFSEGGSGEELTLNGVISRNPADTLLIALRDFDLAPLGRLVEGRGYRLKGRADGNIAIMSLRQKPRMIAGMDFNGLSINDVEAAPVRFTSLWDSDSERVRFRVVDRNTNDDVLRGSFAPSDGSVDATAAIDGLDTGLLDPLLGGVLENTAGTADVDLKFGGTFRQLRMDGRIEVPHFETTVAYTRAKYILDNGVIGVENSRLTLPPTAVHDPMGNTADFGMTVDMSDMRNVTVDIAADVRNLLAVDTGPGDNEAFYGRVFATGTLGIRTDRMGTRMGISATTGRGTVFHLPLNAKSNISWADFVVRADPNRVRVDTTDLLARKKLLYERRMRQDERRAERRKPLDLDVTVDLTPDAEFHMLIDPNLGDGITAHGRGVINMRINPVTNLFSMVGDCTISDGRLDFSMMDAFNKEFTITPGSTLVWTGEPEDALLNIEASYRVRTSLSPLIGTNSSLISGGSTVPVDCILRLSDRLSQPEITFDVRLPSADSDAQLFASNAMNTQELKSTQFLSLLMIGGFASDNSISGQSVNSGALATGAVGLDIFTNQLSNFLSSEDYNVYFRYRPQNDYTGNQFDVGFSTAFVDDRLLLEIEGNYVDNRAATSVGMTDGTAGTGRSVLSNLAGDVSLTWVIDRAGNVRLKVFSQTIDRLNETQGLQESGLGIYYKKDFDSLSDVWRKNRDTFVNFGADSTGTGKTRRKPKR